MKAILGGLMLMWLASCASQGVMIVDKAGLSVPDATLRIDYASFNGPEYRADEQGVIRYSEGQGQEPIQVVVISPTQGQAWFPFPPPSRITLYGPGTSYPDLHQLVPAQQAAATDRPSGRR